MKAKELRDQEELVRRYEDDACGGVMGDWDDDKNQLRAPPNPLQVQRMVGSLPSCSNA